MRVIITVVILIVLVACQGIQPVPKPAKLIAKTTMEDIIYDMSIINSARGYNIQQFSQTGVDPQCYVFEKYKIDSSQYAQNTLYYASSLEDYKELIENVKKRIEEEHKVVDSIAKKEKRITDSTRNARGKRLKQEKDSINLLKSTNKGIPHKTVIEPTLPLH